jgi:hypothetical protein
MPGLGGQTRRSTALPCAGAWTRGSVSTVRRASPTLSAWHPMRTATADRYLIPIRTIGPRGCPVVPSAGSSCRLPSQLGRLSPVCHVNSADCWLTTHVCGALRQSGELARQTRAVSGAAGGPRRVVGWRCVGIAWSPRRTSGSASLTGGHQRFLRQHLQESRTGGRFVRKVDSRVDNARHRPRRIPDRASPQARLAGSRVPSGWRSSSCGCGRPL